MRQMPFFCGTRIYGTRSGVRGFPKLGRGGVLPRDLAPGTMTFLSCGGLEMHGDFMTKAWGPDPLAQALAMIPGYPQTVRAKKSA